MTNTPTHIVLACDESGAKGCANKDEESWPGRSLCWHHGARRAPADRHTSFPSNRYKISGRRAAKFISPIYPDTQEGLRCDVYDAIRAAGVLCFWYAVHVAGFHKHYLRLKGLVDEARSKSSSRIKFSGRDVNLKRHYLHVELFEGLYGNVIAFCHERGKTDLSIEVRVDNTDSSIVRKFDEVSRGLLDFSQRTTRRGFEPATKNWYEVTIRTQLKNPEALGLVTNVHELKLNPVTMTDGFVLAADVLANSLAHPSIADPMRNDIGHLIGWRPSLDIL